MNKTRVLSLIAAALLATGSMAAFAQRGGGGMGGGARGDFGGRSDSHISGSGLRNSNGPDAADRDKGRARAEDRSETRTRTSHGSAHGNAHVHGKH
ncbi:hypothetical protein OR16_26953 [Cupriavidus basilensis OR16]|uniref:Uncharacterized protein n=1 Tax=Cupriavidus basilensis OR16 TaxID=1127483 RepID=H1SB52_9BURK|nr:hypothetical protein [Cupriavidus basilensis]EHP40290.1 hypothetical protein OR16_26953 [Cupriavidus basilensis OR16]